MYLSWALLGSVEPGAIWITPSVAQHDGMWLCIVRLSSLMWLQARLFSSSEGDTHAEVSYSCSCQLMGATQGNRKPCKEWPHGGGAEIFYKPRRNVPGGNRDNEEKHCQVACCWYGEHISEEMTDYCLPVQKSLNRSRILTIASCASSCAGWPLRGIQGCVSAFFWRWCDSKCYRMVQEWPRVQDS